jgi:hypothetical protein
MVIFAQDEDLGQRHLHASDVTLVIEGPAGSRNMFHGNIMLRLDEPKPGDMIYVPVRNKVRRAHEFVFRRGMHLGGGATVLLTETMTETKGGNEIKWNAVRKEELEGLIDDINQHPIVKGEKVRTYTVKKLEDRKIRVCSGLYHERTKPWTKDAYDSMSDESDSDVKGSDRYLHQDKKCQGLPKYGSDPQTSTGVTGA